MVYVDHKELSENTYTDLGWRLGSLGDVGWCLHDANTLIDDNLSRLR